MPQKTELCGFQPTGNSEDVPKPPKFNQANTDKLKEQLYTAKKNIEHVIGTIKHDSHLGTIQTDWILTYLEKVLVSIGENDE